LSIGARRYRGRETVRDGGGMDIVTSSIFTARDNEDKTHARTRTVIREVIKMLAGKDFYHGSDVPPYNPRKRGGNAAVAAVAAAFCVR